MTLLDTNCILKVLTEHILKSWINEIHIVKKQHIVEDKLKITCSFKIHLLHSFPLRERTGKDEDELALENWKSRQDRNKQDWYWKLERARSGDWKTGRNEVTLETRKSLYWRLDEDAHLKTGVER